MALDRAKVEALLKAVTESTAAREAEIEAASSSGALEPQLRIPILGLRKAAVTINNGENDLTFFVERFPRWKRGTPEEKIPPAKRYMIDVRDRGGPGTSDPVAVVLCIYPNGEDKLPEYGLMLSKSPKRATDPQVLYAMQIVYLSLTGIDTRTEVWVDALGIERSPTKRYEIQPGSNCTWCGLPLYKPSSIDRQYGPICAKNLAKKFEYDTTVVKWVRPAE
jgi:hypothetical protein